MSKERQLECGVIDKQWAEHLLDGEIQFFKIFSLSRMIYDPATNFFNKPAKRMAEFEDTAVIICEYNEFIERFGRTIIARYDRIFSLIDRVEFFWFDETRTTNSLFEKQALLLD